MREMGAQPFIGSEALAAGLISWHELGKYYTAIMPNVYLDKRLKPSLRQRVIAAWLWSGRKGVIAGASASALHGAKWVDDHALVELIWRNARAPNGVRTKDELLLDGEVQRLCGLTVTTVERTAFDLGRRPPLGQAITRLDALANATDFKINDVRELARKHPHTRGLRQLDKALDLVDPGAQSPKETWLRLLLINAGFPRPSTQIPLLGVYGHPKYFLDMGWEETSCSRSSTTASNTVSAETSSSKTSNAWNTSGAPAGLTSGCWQSTRDPTSSAGFGRLGTR